MEFTKISNFWPSKKHYEKSEKRIQRIGKRNLQIIYLVRVQYIEYIKNYYKNLLWNQIDHPQAFKTIGILGSSECILLDPDLLGLDVDAFPHFSYGTVCFDVEHGGKGQGAEHILTTPILFFSSVPVECQALDLMVDSQFIHLSQALDAVAMEIEDTQFEECCQDRINGSQVIEGQIDPGQVLQMPQ